MSLHFSKYSQNGKNRELFVMFTKFKIIGDCEEPDENNNFTDIERKLK